MNYSVNCLPTLCEQCEPRNRAIFDKMGHLSRMKVSNLYYNQLVMDNTKLPILEGGKQYLDRRDFLKKAGGVIAGAAMSTAGLAQAVLAQEITPASQQEGIVVAYRESELGIDYRALADAPVDAMLSQGEAEFMANATAVFGDEAAQLWGHDMAIEIGTGRISEFTVHDMREFTPNMLLSFSQIDPNHPKYMLLQTAGENFQLDQHLSG